MDLVKTTWLLLILLVSIILKCTGIIILITNVLFYLVLLYSCSVHIYSIIFIGNDTVSSTVNPLSNTELEMNTYAVPGVIK